MKFLWVVWLCLLGYQTVAQNERIIIGDKPNSYFCVGSFVEYPVSLEGNFPASASFSIEFGDSYYRTPYHQIPATYANGKIRFQVSFPAGLHENQLSSATILRVKSTNPSVVSDWSNDYFYASFLPVVTLTSRSYQANPNSTVPLEFSSFGSSTITALLRDVLTADSLRVTVTTTSALSDKRSEPIPVDKNRSYVLQSVSNRCGTGSGTGNVSIKVNPFSIRTTSVSPAESCTGNQAVVNFSTAGGNLSASGTFKIRLTRLNDNGQEELDTYKEVSATYSGNALSFIVPENIGEWERTYSVRIIQESPYLMSSSDQVRLKIFNPATARFSSVNHTINLGQRPNLSFDLKGTYPQVVHLSDQSTYRNNGYSPKHNLSFPTQTTRYTIQSYSTGCGAGQVDKTPVTVTVQAGFKVDSIPNQIFCEGQNVTLSLTSNVPLTEKATVQIRDYSYGYRGTPIEATIRSNQLRFTIPTLGNSGTVQAQDFILSITAGAYVFETSKMKISTKPSAFFSEGYRQYNINEIQDLDLPIKLMGGGPYELQLSDGRTLRITELSSLDSYYSYPNLRIRPTQAQSTYRLTKVSNTCQTTDLTNTSGNTSIITLTKPASHGIALTVPYQAYCVGDSVLISFQTTGTFGSDNEFRIQRILNDNQVTDLRTLKGTSGRSLNIPITELKNFSIRILSTNPVTQSEAVFLPIQKKPTLSLSTYERALTELLPGDSIPMNISESVTYVTSLTKLVLTNGKQDWTYYPAAADNRSGGFYTNFYPPESGSYRIKSATNVCGTTSGSGVLNVDLKPYRIFFPTAYASQKLVFCTKGSYQLPYGIAGSMPGNVKLMLEVAAAKDSVFREITSSIGTNLAAFQIPDTYTSGSYLIRLRAGDIPSTALPFELGTLPTATLSADGPTQVDYSLPMKITFTGQGPWNVTWNDGTIREFQLNPSTISEHISKTSTFELKGVTNGCGYGSVSGKVTGTVKARLTVSSSTNTICSGSSLLVRYYLDGEFNTSNKIRVGLYTARKGFIPLDSVTTTVSGTITVKIPAQLEGSDFYELRVITTSPQLSESRPLYLSFPPSYRLIGSNTINPGQYSTLRLINQNAASNIQTTINYELSTGQKGVFYNDSKEQTLSVAPTQTTTYTITSISNGCGKGSATGSATVTVNPPAERMINTQFVSTKSGYGYLCKGDTIFVSYETKGSFSATNLMSIQLSDSLGQQFTSLPTLPSNRDHELAGILPTTLKKGSGYRIRVVASDPSSMSSASATFYTTAEKASVKFGVAQLPMQVNGSVYKLPLEFTGDAPFSVSWGVEPYYASFFTNNLRDSLRIEALSPSLTYKIRQVTNVCGIGTVLEPNTLKVELITATEPTASHTIKAFPNPTTDQIRVEGLQPGSTMQLMTLTGQVIQQTEAKATQEDLSLRAVPPGIYLLHIQNATVVLTFRIQKL
ncbi:T9SS type A sorting domain-containing protein [Siphonobacter curvatus]|uniref:Secretion system C-terminal sorting domain-containing protein n=1 Tax=Siphonobacter curvatus TaxID=2094562 RepID=A0A2S7IM31_9BACT|nr:T9SS type A sorting domain-containing protein [Siphonobacter curvatus]PQA58801.1 hypothetical protein C5O19_03825 [Siphonobacter curvatus]